MTDENSADGNTEIPAWGLGGMRKQQGGVTKSKDGPFDWCQTPALLLYELCDLGKLFHFTGLIFLI